MLVFVMALGLPLLWSQPRWKWFAIYAALVVAIVAFGFFSLSATIGPGFAVDPSRSIAMAIALLAVGAIVVAIRHRTYGRVEAPPGPPKFHRDTRRR